MAGYLGGRARVVASTVSLRMVDGFAVLMILKDSLTIGYGVPGLIRLSDSITSGVYWIGGTPDHLQTDHFYVRAGLDTALRVIAESLHITANGTDYYPQYNDASLPNGGTFSVRAQAFIGQLFERPYGEKAYGAAGTAGHSAHNTGLDIDIGLCLADAQGDGSDKVHRVYGHYDRRVTPPLSCSKSGANRPIVKTRLDGFARLFNGVNGVHPADTAGTHYHIRFQ